MRARREILRRAGIDPAPLRNIDEVDAAFCALTAQHFTASTFNGYGDAAGGFIIVPAQPLRASAALACGLPKKPWIRMGKRVSVVGKTAALGFTNDNGQVVEQQTDLPGSDHNQFIYVLRCGRCTHRYGANGSDIFQRKCPRCQGGRPGLAFNTDPPQINAHGTSKT